MLWQGDEGGALILDSISTTHTSHSTAWKSCSGQLKRSRGSTDHCITNSQRGLDSGDKLPSQCEHWHGGFMGGGRQPLAAAAVTHSPRLSPLYLQVSGRSGVCTVLPCSSCLPALRLQLGLPRLPPQVALAPRPHSKPHTSGPPWLSSAEASGKGRGESVELGVTHTGLSPGYFWPSAPSPGGRSMGGFPAETM